MPIELMFILQRLAAMAEQDPSLRERQPWKAAYDKDYKWLSDVITKHYAGDDSDVKVLLGGMVQAFAGMTVEEYGAAADGFVNQGEHPTLGTAVHRLRVPADGGAAAVPRGERVHRLHRVGRQPGLHADVRRGDLRDPARAGDRAARTSCSIGRTTAAAQSSTRTSPTCSTTARPSRCGSGVASGAARSSPGATPTATSRCCSSPAARPAPGCGCSSCTTTPTASSTTPPGPRTPSTKARAQDWTVVSIKDDWATVFADHP